MSKGQPAELIREGLEAGLRDFGENYVQECEGKRAVLPGARWHLLGHLQRNKAARAARLFDSVRSLDGLRLGSALSQQRAGASPLEVLLEVDFTDIPGRRGYREAELERELPQLRQLPGIKILGLLTVADPQAPRRAFSKCRELAERLRAGEGPGLELLSMGMSEDFAQAIQEGSTEVRIGSRLFGPRAAPPTSEEAGWGPPLPPGMALPG